MATAWITEYTQIGTDRNGRIPLALEPGTDQTVTFTTSTQSSAFASGTVIIRLIASAACHVVFGASPTATALKQFVPANTEIWRRVIPGDKVAVYDGSS